MAFDSRPTPPSRACPGRGVSPSGPGSRDSRDDEVRGREHAATAAVVVPLGCVVDRDFVPRSWAPGRSNGGRAAGDSVCGAAASASPLPAGPRTAPRHPRSRFHRATVRRPTLGPGHRPRPRPPPPPPPLLRSCTVTGSALSACACNTRKPTNFRTLSRTVKKYLTIKKNVGRTWSRTILWNGRRRTEIRTGRGGV